VYEVFEVATGQTENDDAGREEARTGMSGLGPIGDRVRQGHSRGSEQ